MCNSLRGELPVLAPGTSAWPKKHRNNCGTMNDSASFDYLILGGGSAGCVLAARLSEDPSVTVALLEAGPSDRSPLIHVPLGIAALARTGAANWQHSTTPQPGLNGRRGYQPRGKVLGGSSSINAMIYIRGQRQDYDQWALEGNPGWSYDDVLPYFLRAEDNARGPGDFHATGGPLHVQDLTSPNPLVSTFIDAAHQAGHAENNDFNAASQEGVGAYQVTHKNGERHSAAKAYLTPNLSRPNLRVFTEAHVLRILLDKKRATGVEFVQGGLNQKLFARREVLLCAGALQSPQILMLSGIGDKNHLLEHRIVPAHDLPGVGQNLHDHLDVVQVVHAPGLHDSVGVSVTGVRRLLGAVFEWRRQRTGLLTSNVAEAGGFLKSHPDEPRPDLQLHFVIAKLVNHGRTTVLGHGFSCHLCVLRPKSRGSVRLASKGPFAAPQIDPNFLSDRDDLDRLVRGFRMMRTLLSQEPLKRLGGFESPKSAQAQTNLEIEQFIRDTADTIYHPVGTCRMGPGPLDVVDSSLRVHGIAALRVVDASIMPNIVSGNTNAPTIMIAEKAADLIKAAA
jgi:choline dehydrogenase-like flavoprotein